MSIKHNKKYDLTGIILSSLCGVHCLITPFLLISIPEIGEGLQSAWAHTVLMLFMAWTFYLSVYKHFLLHKSKITLGTGLIGFFLLLISYVNEVFFHAHGDEHDSSHGHGHSDENIMIIIALLGAILIITSHFLNIKKCSCLRGEDTCLVKD